MQILSGRNVTVSLYFIILICFFMPFVNVNCGNTQLVTFTGFNLVVGKALPNEAQGSGLFGPTGSNSKSKAPERSSPELFAIIAFLAIILGLVIMSSKPDASTALKVIIPIVGFIALLVEKGRMDSSLNQEMAKQGMQGMITLQWLSAYYVALWGFLVTGVQSAIGKMPAGGFAVTYQGAKPPPQAPPVEQRQILQCSICGTLGISDSSFCTKCGESLSGQARLLSPQQFASKQVNCERCGQAYVSGTRYCGTCGVPLPQSSAPVVPSIQDLAPMPGYGPQCVLCNAVSPVGSHYCRICGSIVQV